MLYTYWITLCLENTKKEKKLGMVEQDLELQILNEILNSNY